MGAGDLCARQLWGLAGSGSFGVYHDGGFDSLHEEAEAGIDLTQAALAILIAGVFAAIAVAGGPDGYRSDGRAFSGEEEVVFVSEALEAARSDVVFEWSGRGVGLRVSGESFSHGGAVNG